MKSLDSRLWQNNSNRTNLEYFGYFKQTIRLEFLGVLRVQLVC